MMRFIFQEEVGAESITLKNESQVRNSTARASATGGKMLRDRPFGRDIFAGVLYGLSAASLEGVRVEGMG